MTAELSARLRDPANQGMGNLVLEAADALDANARELAQKDARIAELEQALPKVEWRDIGTVHGGLYLGGVFLGTIHPYRDGRARAINRIYIVIGDFPNEPTARTAVESAAREALGLSTLDTKEREG